MSAGKFSNFVTSLKFRKTNGAPKENYFPNTKKQFTVHQVFRDLCDKPFWVLL